MSQQPPKCEFQYGKQTKLANVVKQKGELCGNDVDSRSLRPFRCELHRNKKKPKTPKRKEREEEEGSTLEDLAQRIEKIEKKLLEIVALNEPMSDEERQALHALSEASDAANKNRQESPKAAFLSYLNQEISKHDKRSKEALFVLTIMKALTFQPTTLKEYEIRWVVEEAWCGK